MFISKCIFLICKQNKQVFTVCLKQVRCILSVNGKKVTIWVGKELTGKKTMSFDHWNYLPSTHSPFCPQSSWHSSDVLTGALFDDGMMVPLTISAWLCMVFRHASTTSVMYPAAHASSPVAYQYRMPYRELKSVIKFLKHRQIIGVTLQSQYWYLCSIYRMSMLCR